jgi:hypothetical protein
LEIKAHYRRLNRLLTGDVNARIAMSKSLTPIAWHTP